MCHIASETIDHIIAGCQNLANTEYLHRHNLTANIIHQELALHYGIIPVKDAVPYYEYKPQPVLENQNCRLYYDVPIHTDKTITANRPDIVIHNLMEKTAVFIDVTHPNDHNIDKAQSEKIQKYVPLTSEYKDIYKLKSVQTIPIVITATGVVHKQTKSSITKQHLNPNKVLPKAQKSVILETRRIVRSVLNIPTMSRE